MWTVKINHQTLFPSFNIYLLFTDSRSSPGFGLNIDNPVSLDLGPILCLHFTGSDVVCTFVAECSQRLKILLTLCVHALFTPYNERLLKGHQRCDHQQKVDSNDCESLAVNMFIRSKGCVLGKHSCPGARQKQSGRHCHIYPRKPRTKVEQAANGSG